MRRVTPRHRLIAASMGLAFVAGILAFSASAATRYPLGSSGFASAGGLDCNGWSTIQKPVKQMGVCTDVRGFAGVSNQHSDDGRFYDNGHYVGHDEPTLTYLSYYPHSGNDVTWTETLPRDPVAAPTVSNPGTDTTHWFELSVAPWFGMALCDPGSYPQLPCTPKRDANAPQGRYPGGGGAFLEVQFYPPGEGPFPDNISCDNTHWCAALHINELECTFQFASCNPRCTETTNFAFIQRNGVPTGPASPQLMNLATSTPNAETLFMNPGDRLRVHIWDAPAPAVPDAGIPRGHALMVRVTDLTTGQTGYMQASAKNGYASTDIVSCNGRLFNYEPEYNTAEKAHIVPWAALQGDIMTEFELGHFEPCTSVTQQIFTGAGGSGDPVYNTCNGPYESASDSGTPEGGGDAVCYPKGDTHGTLNSAPNEVAGCEENVFENGDLDFDGTPYYADWPTGTTATATTPGSFVQQAPTSKGETYPFSFFQTTVALSESTCFKGSSGCTVPPSGPGGFYPYWSTIRSHGQCSVLFGNVATGPHVRTYGGDAQYGHDRHVSLGYDEFEGAVGPAVC